MKKKLISILTAIMIVALAILPGCYVVQSQKMTNVKGTYQLSHYSITDGETSKVTDYVAKYGYEEYLIVTGTSQGYLVHKDNSTPAYSRPVTLSYEYNEDDSSLVSYVIYRTGSSSNEEQRLGVTKDSLNYNRPGINIGIAHTDTISKGFKKVDKATDLSYAKSKLGPLNEYTVDGWNHKGMWELSAQAYDETTYEYTDASPYVYYYAVFNGYDNQFTIHYALKPTDSTAQPEKQQKTVTLADDHSWNAFTLDGIAWSVYTTGYSYESVDGNTTWRLARTYQYVDLTELETQIQNRIDAFMNVGDAE